ncbi:MAG: HlyC/CorC family transporter [Saprospiraceae bacterium]|nr:HlyC/CorC family transporter [Saprospiraceae bacterium]
MVAGILIFLLLSALFSGSEIAFLSANKLIVELKKKKGSRRGSLLAGFFEKPSDFLSTLLVGNNIALVVFTSLMSVPLSILFNEQLGIQNQGILLVLNTLIITIVVLIFGEFLPKTLFRLYADDILFALTYPLQIIRIILAIPAWIMIKLSNLLLRLFLSPDPQEVEGAFTRLDLEHFIKTSRTEANDEIDTELFEKALHLREVRVKECMIPRPEIVSIDIQASIDELVEAFQKSNLSRIIVYKDDIDEVEGYVHHQQLLNNPKRIAPIIMTIPYVPEFMRVRELMNQFIKTRTNIACVVDEFGGTSGIITLEDILEEIFGEIEDEHDQEEYIEEQISDSEYLLSGRLEIDYLNEKYPYLGLPEGDYHTLSGYLVMTTGTIPEQGAEILLGDSRYQLVMVSDTKIETVRIFKIDPNELLPIQDQDTK